MSTLRLEARDRAIFRAIHACRVLTSTQIAAKFFPRQNGEPGNDVHDSTAVNPKCRQRLLRLVKAGYLERGYLPATPKEGRRPYLYFLSDGAAAILAQEAGSSPSEFDWRRRDNLLSESSTLPHLIALNDVRISLEVDAEQRGVQILIWETERELKARSIKVPREHKGDEQQQEFMALIPDSYFCLYAPLGIVDQNDSYSYAYFLEIDLNTEHAPLNSSDHPPNYFTTKVVKYLNYLASDKPQRQFSFEAIRVLTVTTDSKRLEKLLLATESKGGGQHFWFTTFADIVPIQSALTKPIWWQAGNREKRTLIW